MSRVKSFLLPFLVFLTMPLSSVFYTLTNKHTGTVHNIQIALDNYIPIIEIFAIPYLAWDPYVMISMIILAVKDRTIYYRYMGIMNIGFVVCFAIYTWFQTTFTRPLADTSGWAADIMHTIQSYDQPFNCFPSLHVVTSWITIKAFYHSKIQSKATRWTVYALGVIIILSTLFIKQHVILDVIGGIALVEICEFALKRIRAARGGQVQQKQAA